MWDSPHVIVTPGLDPGVWDAWVKPGYDAIFFGEQKS